MEASSSPEIALKYYSELLEADSANAAIWKRKISVLRRTGKTEKTVSELCAFLDTFYTDVEGWLELGDLYAESCQYVDAFLCSYFIAELISCAPN